MKKNLFRLLSLLLVVCTVAAAFAACDLPFGKEPDPTEAPHIDYVSQVKLDMNSSTQKKAVTWGDRSHIDGDTSHFEVEKEFDASKLMKVRYLAVNTPESTGQVEEWGKKASNFTKEKLENAVSIILESDSDQWNFDGNGRYLCWVWYKPSEDAEYRNLNIELLQEGLGRSSSSADNRYGAVAVEAIAQASREQLYVFSKEKDPDFPYGEAISVSLRELRSNIESYVGQKVAVEGIITSNSNWEAYIEYFDNETGMNFGMQIFYGYNTQLINVLAKGNKVRVVGVVNSFRGTYQISGLKYNALRPTDPANTAIIKESDSKYDDIIVNPFPEVSAEAYTGNVTLEVNEESKTFKFTELAVSTSISMKNLKVIDTWTTVNPSASDVGAMTLTCNAFDKDGNLIKDNKNNAIEISVRTAVLKDADGNIITASAYKDKTIDVSGTIEHYEGTYQIKVLTPADINVH